MKIKLFLAREIQYFELEIFSFNSYVYYLTRGFIASTCAFNLATRAFSLLTRGFELVTRVLLFHLKLHRKIGVSVSFFFHKSYLLSMQASKFCTPFRVFWLTIKNMRSKFVS